MQVQYEKIVSFRMLLIIFALAIVNILMLLFAQHIEKRQLLDDQRLRLTAAITSIEDNLRENSLALERMAQRWNRGHGTAESDWRSDAKAYSRDLLGVVATGYADSQSKIKWIEPMDENLAAVGFVLASESHRSQALETARLTNKPTMTAPISLRQSGLGHLILMPVFQENRLDGYVYLVSRYSEYFPKLLRDDESIYIITSGSDMVYQSKEHIEPGTEELAVSSDRLIHLSNSWSMKILPTLKKIDRYRWTVSSWTLLCSISFTFFIRLTFYFLEKSRRLSKITQDQDAWKNALLNSTDLSVISTNTNGVVVSFNAASEKLLGYKSAEVVGVRTPALWHDEQEIVDRASVLSKEFGTEVVPGFDVFAFKAKLGIHDKNVWNFITKSGLRKQVTLSVHAITNQSDQIVGFVGIIEEITDSNRFKDEVFAREKIIYSLIDNAFDGYWDWDIKTNSEYMSPRFWQMLGYDPSEKNHNPSEWKKLIAADELERCIRMYETHVASKGEIPYHVDLKFKHKRGSDVWVTRKGRVLEWDEHGHPLRMVGSFTNISELRFKAEEVEQDKKAISERESKIIELNSRDNDWFRIISNALPQLLWTCRVDGPCDYLSDQWVAFTGIPEKAQLGFEWLNQLHPDDRDRVISEWQEKVIREELFSIKFRIRRHDGIYHWFQTMAIPLRNENGKLMRWLGSNTDIEEIYSMKMDLEKKERQLQDAQSLAKIGNWELDLASGELFWSKQMYEFFGIDESTGVRYPDELKDNYTAEFPGEMKEKLELCKAKGDPFSGRIIVGKSSRRKWLMVRGTAIFERNRITGVRGTCQDITEEVEISNELQETKTRLLVALEGSDIGIWEWDIENSSLVWDDQMFKIYGQSRKDFSNSYEAWIKGVHPDDIDEAKLNVELALQNARPFNTQFRVVKNSGDIGYVMGRAKVIVDGNGKAKKMVGINLDITKIKLNEFALEKSKQEALQASVAKAQFLANMSHEIRTPLNGIIGMSNLLKDTVLDETQKEYLEHLGQSSSMLLSLINDILDLSKIESGKIDMEEIDFNLE